MPGIIDSFWVALGYKVDTAGIEQMKAKVDDARESILSWGTAIAGLITGAALHKVAELGSTFEQNGIQIAGFLSALSNGKTSYEEGLVQARDVIAQITKDAAKLPGEAEEYIEVFKAGLPFVQGAMPGGSLKDMTDFTNRLTAIGKTFGLDAGLIAREFDHMLAPGAGTASLRLPLFRQLLPFMHQVKGQANLTAQSFNAMTAPKRLELLQSTFAKLQPMLDASADSFDAMWGTLTSMVKQLTRMGSGGLFSTMKKQIQAFSSEFMDDEGKLTERGKDVVAIIGRIGSVIGTLLRDGVQFTFWLMDLTKNSAAFKVVLVALAGLLAGAVWESIAVKIAKLAKGMRAATMVTGLLWIALGLIIEDVWGFFHGADSLTGMLVDQLGPGVYIVAAAVGALATAFIALKVQAIATAAGMVIAFLPIFLVIAAVALLSLGVYELYQHWQEVLDFVQDRLNGWLPLLNKVIDALNVVNRLMGADDNHLIKHVSAFGFADEHRNSEYNQATLGPGNGVLAPSYGPQAADASMWQPQFSMAGSGGGGTVTHGDVHFGDINIKTDNPREAGREVQRVLRGAQSGRVI